MDASKVLIQALASEEDETPPLGSYMDPDSDDEMPPLVSASDSSDSETDDEGTPRRENAGTLYKSVDLSNELTR